MLQAAKKYAKVKLCKVCFPVLNHIHQEMPYY